MLFLLVLVLDWKFGRKRKRLPGPGGGEEENQDILQVFPLVEALAQKDGLFTPPWYLDG